MTLDMARKCQKQNFKAISSYFGGSDKTGISTAVIEIM